MNYAIEEMEREMHALKEQLAQRNAACAEMRDVVSNLADIAQNNDISKDEFDRIESYKSRALSSDCGKDYFSREQVMPLVEALEKLSRLGNEPFLGNSDGNVIAQRALAHVKETGVIK
jgi:hypothetical protein